MNTTQALATLTNRQESEIRSYTMMYAVINVHFTKGSSRFVSLRKFRQLMAAQPKPFSFTLNAGRDRRKPWVAKITGLSHDQYRFTREFVEPESIEWNKKGCDSARFVLTEVGIYQDQDTGYYRVFVDGDALSFSEMSWMEVQDIMERNEVQARPIHPAAVGIF
jgi:hypothetical protein